MLTDAFTCIYYTDLPIFTFTFSLVISLNIPIDLNPVFYIKKSEQEESWTPYKFICLIII